MKIEGLVCWCGNDKKRDFTRIWDWTDIYPDIYYNPMYDDKEDTVHAVFKCNFCDRKIEICY